MTEERFNEIASATKDTGLTYNGCKIYSNPFIEPGIMYFINEDNMYKEKIGNLDAAVDYYNRLLVDNVNKALFFSPMAGGVMRIGSIKRISNFVKSFRIRLGEIIAGERFYEDEY